MKPFSRVFVSLFCLTLTSCLEKREETTEIGYTGEARRNAFLAAQQLYQSYGVEASSSLHLDEMPWDGTMLIMPGEAITTPSRARQLKTWVENGGHLVYLLHGTGMMRWESEGGHYEEPELVDHPLLDAYGIRFGELTDNESTTSFDLGNYSGRVLFPLSNTFDLTGTDDVDHVMGKDAENALMVSIDSGNGRFTALASAFPMRNRAIAQEDHAAFTLALSDLHECYEVLFVYASDLSFWSMLWEAGWMPLLGLLTLLLFWLWKSLPSFGPRLPPAAALPCHFSDHLGMTAQFLWRHSAPNSLLAPARRRLVKHYQSSTGRSLPVFNDPELHAYLAERSGQPLDRVHEAMLGEPKKDANQFTRLIQDITLLETSL
ncbi:DUF4350 domain-containing protein [bacterium]|nr:DUF4350 domain-containing protein [bacterium]